MITLPENKHITKRYELSEINAQVEDGEYSAELLLQHLCAHANDMQRENAILRDAVKWCLEKEPSPCRCMDFATPPHVCIAHKALNLSNAQDHQHRP